MKNQHYVGLQYDMFELQAKFLGKSGFICPFTQMPLAKSDVNIGHCLHKPTMLRPLYRQAGYNKSEFRSVVYPENKLINSGMSHYDSPWGKRVFSANQPYGTDISVEEGRGAFHTLCSVLFRTFGYYASDCPTYRPFFNHVAETSVSREPLSCRAVSLACLPIDIPNATKEQVSCGFFNPGWFCNEDLGVVVGYIDVPDATKLQDGVATAFRLVFPAAHDVNHSAFYRWLASIDISISGPVKMDSSWSTAICSLKDRTADSFYFPRTHLEWLKNLPNLKKVANARDVLCDLQSHSVSRASRGYRAGLKTHAVYDS